MRRRGLRQHDGKAQAGADEEQQRERAAGHLRGAHGFMGVGGVTGHGVSPSGRDAGRRRLPVLVGCTRDAAGPAVRLAITTGRKYLCQKISRKDVFASREIGWSSTMDEAERAGDAVDRYRAAWRIEAPAIDTEPMAILGRINRIAHLVAPEIEQLFARHGLDRGEFDVIATLRRSGTPYRLSPTELYTSLMISSGGLTHRLARLEAAGLIRREASPTDGRSLLVALTEKGRRRAEAAFADDMLLEGSWIARLPSAERRQLAALLRRLHAVLTPPTEEASRAESRAQRRRPSRPSAPATAGGLESAARSRTRRRRGVQGS
ncbi:MarR family transcriptional regulator [Leptolyngbya sp. 15MV]|nr:MarR family transcriptional regulator [Leptolyngbya sp. 15MV]